MATVWPTEAQVAEYLELIEAGIAHDAAAEEAFGPVKLKDFYSMTDDGYAVAWDVCARCHQHISLCACSQVKIPEYIKRWQARRRGLETNPIDGTLREPLPTAGVVADTADPNVTHCRRCFEVITAPMAALGVTATPDTPGPWAVQLPDGEWACNSCVSIAELEPKEPVQ